MTNPRHKTDLGPVEVTEIVLWHARNPPTTRGLVVNMPVGGMSFHGRLFQARMWLNYAMTWHGKRTKHGIDRRWCEEIGRWTYAELIRRARGEPLSGPAPASRRGAVSVAEEDPVTIRAILLAQKAWEALSSEEREHLARLDRDDALARLLGPAIDPAADLDEVYRMVVEGKGL